MQKEIKKIFKSSLENKIKNNYQLKNCRFRKLNQEKLSEILMKLSGNLMALSERRKIKRKLTSACIVSEQEWEVIIENYIHAQLIPKFD